MILVEPVSTTFAPRTAPSSTRTPSTTTHRDPTKASPRRPEGPALLDAPRPDGDAPGPDKGIVLDHHGHGTRWLEHPADADPAGEVYVPARLGAGAHRGPGAHPRARPAGVVSVPAALGAGANRGPGVHHRAAPHVRPDVHVARHHGDARLDEGPVANRPGRDDADAGLGEV